MARELMVYDFDLKEWKGSGDITPLMIETVGTVDIIMGLIDEKFMDGPDTYTQQGINFFMALDTIIKPLYSGNDVWVAIQNPLDSLRLTIHNW